MAFRNISNVGSSNKKDAGDDVKIELLKVELLLLLLHFLNKKKANEKPCSTI